MTKSTDEQWLDKIQAELEELEHKASFYDMHHEDYKKTHNAWVSLLNERHKLNEKIQTNMHSSYSKGK